MKPEQQMWSRARKALKSLDPVRVENGVCPGTPDVNLTTGWMELKCEEKWPVKGGPLRVPHFTPQQRAWLQRRSFRGGKTWLLLRVANDWFLFTGPAAAEYLGTSTKEVLQQQCVRCWMGGLVDEELLACLQSH